MPHKKLHPDKTYTGFPWLVLDAASREEALQATETYPGPNIPSKKALAVPRCPNFPSVILKAASREEALQALEEAFDWSTREFERQCTEGDYLHKVFISREEQVTDSAWERYFSYVRLMFARYRYEAFSDELVHRWVTNHDRVAREPMYSHAKRKLARKCLEEVLPSLPKLQGKHYKRNVFNAETVLECEAEIVVCYLLLKEAVGKVFRNNRQRGARLTALWEKFPQMPAEVREKVSDVAPLTRSGVARAIVAAVYGVTPRSAQDIIAASLRTHIRQWREYQQIEQLLGRENMERYIYVHALHELWGAGT